MTSDKNTLKGKTAVLGVTGSIAAYKIVNLARMLRKLGANVQVLMTKNATEFITPLTFEQLTGNKCLIDTFDRNFQYSVEHVALAKQADVVLVAPGLCQRDWQDRERHCRRYADYYGHGLPLQENHFPGHESQHVPQSDRPG